MKICGIIVEYNPFTYGHRYHIDKAKSLSQCDVLVAVMSGNFVQRGEVAIIDKWQRAKCAIEMGVDLVIELPYIYATQSASQFAQGGIQILNLIGADTFVFGSESNHLERLLEIAELNINVDHLKESLKKGESFPHAYSLLQGQYPPNDILGIAYLKALKGTKITPFSIKRTTDYHDTTIQGQITSATSIRHALKLKQETQAFTPLTFDYTHTNEAYFKTLKHLLLTLSPTYLQSIFLVNEGIENHLIKCIKQTDTYDDFIQLAPTRRYTKSRIQRVLIQLLNQVTKQEEKDLGPLNYIRPLAFNQKGQALLAHLKNKEELIIANRFGQIPKNYRALEYKAAITYSLYLEEKHQKKILNNEIQGPLIIKGNEE